MKRSNFVFLFVFSLVVAGVYALISSLMLPGITERASIAYNGQQANEASFSPSVSADGRYVVFSSYADNLMPDDFNWVDDVFVYDRQAGVVTTRIEGGLPMISADGRFIVFASADPLVPDDTNGVADVFLYHVQTGYIERVSLGSGGQQANGWNDISVVSDDGRFVIFRSYSTNLSPIPTNGQWQLYLHDRVMNLTEMVTVSTAGEASNQGGGYQSISADGRFVVFSTWADNLVPNDTNNSGDVFVRDRLSGVTWRITTGPTGEQGNEDSYGSYISANGRYVVFTSIANNLVLNDTNNRADTFVHDLLIGETERVNLTMAGQQSNEHGGAGNISADGRFVTFVIDNSIKHRTNG